MVAGIPNASEQSRIPASTDQLRPVREAVGVIDRLLKLLFTESPPLDIVTVQDVLDRYPLTGLGVPALAAIEQSRRIVRAGGDYEQVGLCEFHIGLVYLYWDDGRAAANQFAGSRQPWSLVNDTPAMCLAHYAQGLGLYHSYHNEAAMLQFGRAERLLERPAIGAQAERFAALAAEMRPLLTIAQETLRESLWPRDQQSAEALQAGYLSVPEMQQTGEWPGDGQSAAPRPSASRQAVAQPESRLGMRRAPERPVERPEWAKRVPPPMFRPPESYSQTSQGPVPGHVTTDDRFGWYIIADNKGDFLPEMGSGTWLLADLKVDEHVSSEREYVVVGSSRADLGSVLVQAVSYASALPYCYLGYRITDDSSPNPARLYLDETDEPLPEEELFVLAVVEGFWQGANDHASRRHG